MRRRALERDRGSWLARAAEIFALEPMAHRPPLVWRFWIYTAAAYLMPVVVQIAFPIDSSSMDELVWLVTLAPAFILSLHYGLRGAFVALLMGTALLVTVQLSLALYYESDDPRVIVPIYIAYSALAISVGWLSEQLHEHYELALELEAKQKTDGLARLAAGLGHDFNNILTTMVGSAELIAGERSPGTTDERQELEYLKTAARRGAGIVRNLLGLSQRGMLTLKPLDLRALLENLEPRLERLVPETVAIELEFAEELPPVSADERAVEEIVTNLVTNARDAMPIGGSLRIEVEPARLTREAFERRGWGDPGEYVRLNVSDSGVGMDDDALERVFEPFFTTKDPGEGIGLGMAVVYGLVKQHRGFVDVESRPEEGTTAAVYFPVSPVRKEPAGQETVPEEPGTERAAPRKGTETILVVEDQQSIRHVAERILEGAGYTVVTAADGAEALSVYQQKRDEISLVLCDVLLPELTGPEVYEAIRTSPDPPPFLFMSGYPADNLVDGGSLDPALPFLAKPWTVEELTGAVRDVLSPEGAKETPASPD